MREKREETEETDARAKLEKTDVVVGVGIVVQSSYLSPTMLLVLGSATIYGCGRGTAT